VFRPSSLALQICRVLLYEEGTGAVVEIGGCSGSVGAVGLWAQIAGMKARDPVANLIGW
jgi:hypothetical protein